jgi:hypothetical protein
VPVPMTGRKRLAANFAGLGRAAVFDAELPSGMESANCRQAARIYALNLNNENGKWLNEILCSHVCERTSGIMG